MSTKVEPVWRPAAILPNLSLQKAIGGDEIAIAPRSDPRVVEFGSANPTFQTFLCRFTDAFSAPLDPAVLVVREGLLTKLGQVEPLASFRDLVALSTIPYARSIAAISTNPRHIFYSNSFAFYPWTLHPGYERLVLSTPAVTDVREVGEFHGQSSAELPVMELSQLDEPLYKALLGRWKGHYLGRRQRWRDRALFRSLNMANQAARLPAGIDPTMYDLGRITALWVSAFEILAHPRTANSGLRSVYPLLERVRYHDKRVGSRRFAAYMGRDKRPWPRRPLPCWLYGKLYQARCAFLHGSPVRASLLMPTKSKEGLFWLAPSLYRLALAGFLRLPFKKKLPQRNEYQLQQFEYFTYQRVIEEALLKFRS